MAEELGDLPGGDMAGGGTVGGLGGAGGGGEERCGVAGGPVRGGRAARLGAHERASLLLGPVAVPGAGVVVVGSVGCAPRAVGRGMTSASRRDAAVSGMAVPGMAVPGMAKSWSGPCRCAGGPAVPGRARGRGRLGAGGEDALDGAVGRVSGRGGLRAGGLEPAGVVLVGQPEHALGGAQPEQRVLGQQFVDHAARRPGRPRRPGVRHQVGVRRWKAIFSGG